MNRDDIDDAADGAGAVKIAGASAGQFDVVDGERGLLLPVDPAAERVVEGHILLRDECAASGGGTEAAQADALRRGIGNERWRAAEEFDAGKLPELIVERDAGSGGQRLLREDARGGRAFEIAEWSAISGDGDLFCAGGGL